MKKSFSERIRALESQIEDKRPRMSITYFDEELGITMQIIGNGLVVPLPIAPEDWERKAAVQQAKLIAKYSQKHL